MKHTLLLSLLLFFWTSHLFSQKSTMVKLPTHIQQALVSAGKNQPELKKAIHYFSKQAKDSLKLKALFYLLNNMKWNRSAHLEILPDPAFIRIFQLADSLYFEVVKGKSSQEIQEAEVNKKIAAIQKYIQDTMSHSAFEEPKITPVESEQVSDLNILKSDFLIDHINNAFDLKNEIQQVQKLGFSEFCAYILPYRLIDGMNFRYSGKDFRKFFGKYLGDINAKDLTEQVALYNITLNNLRYILGNYPFLHRTGFEELFFKRVENFDCFSVSNYGNAAMNACGIPVDLEFNMAYKMFQGKHSDCLVPSSLGNWALFTPESGKPQPKTTAYETYTDWMNRYRIHFSAQKDAPYFLKGAQERIPQNLSDPTIEDATTRSLFTIALSLPFKESTSNKLAYLATFNSATGILPITWGLINQPSQMVRFPNVIPDRLYFPVYYQEDELTSFDRPFYVKLDSSKKNGYQILYLEEIERSSQGLSSFIVTRKFPRKPAMIQVAEELKGAVVIGSNDSLYKQADTLYTLDFTLAPQLQDITWASRKPFRFFRVLGPKEHPVLNISELELLTSPHYPYTDTGAASPLPVLSPSAIHVPDTLIRLLPLPLEKLRTYNISDGNMETSPGKSFRSTTISNSFKEARIVSGFRLAPLNANNGIVRGNEYLLRYWDKGNWNDFEYPQTAEFEFLEFKDAPKGKLYWLKNLTTGREELPFIMDEKGNQRFIYFDIK